MQWLKDQGLDQNTIVIFTTDNGAEVFTWPDGGNTPFAGSKGMVMDGGVSGSSNRQVAGACAGRLGVERHHFGPRLAPDVDVNSWQPQCQRPIAQGLDARWEELPGPSGRL
jgi:hypothetical protein